MRIHSKSHFIVVIGVSLLLGSTAVLRAEAPAAGYQQPPPGYPPQGYAPQQQMPAQPQGAPAPGTYPQGAPPPAGAYPQQGAPQAGAYPQGAPQAGAYPQGAPQAGAYPQGMPPQPGYPQVPSQVPPGSPGAPVAGFPATGVPAPGAPVPGVPGAAPAPGAPGAPAVAGKMREIIILPATDTTPLNLSTAMQKKLGTLFTETGEFKIRYGAQTLQTYSQADVAKMHQTLNSELFSFVYLEKDRVAVFLFDKSRPQQFVVATETVNIQNANPQAHIEGQLALAQKAVVRGLKEGLYQPLPGIASESVALTKEEKEELAKRAKESQELFRELSQVTDRPTYIGALIGMARYNTSARSASNVDFGVIIGRRLGSLIRVELGLDMFSYAMANGALTFRIPLAEKYVFIAASVGGAYVLAQTTANIGNDAPLLTAGNMLFGPGVTFNIPLLGANIRADLRYYLGPAAVFVGTYGLSYSL